MKQFAMAVLLLLWAAGIVAQPGAFTGQAQQLPSCWCSNLGQCDVTVETIARMVDVEGNVIQELTWKHDNLPRPIAYTIYQAGVAVINQANHEIYTMTVEACAGQSLADQIRGSFNKATQ